MAEQRQAIFMGNLNLKNKGENNMQTLKLNNGTEIPTIGFWSISSSAGN